MERNEITRGVRAQKIFIYTILRWLIGRATCLIANYRFKYKPIKAKTFLLLSNHTTNVDPMLDVITTRRHFRFVASANIMQGFPGILVKWLASPIPRYKGAPADEVTGLIKENLKNGISVAIYPEGNTSWDGRTGFISKHPAQLVKESGVALVTYKIEGAYLLKSRWSKTRRRGRCRGGIVAEYSPEELASMSVDEVWEIIKRDLYTDAYEYQRKTGQKFKGKNRAEGIEVPLYLCPSCKRFGELRAKGDTLRCSCGRSWAYDDEGYLNGDDGSRWSVAQWFDFEKKYIRENADALKAQTDEPIYNGTLKAYGDRFELDGKVYPYSGITKLSVYKACSLFFTCNDEYVSFTAPEGESVGPVYDALWRVLTGRSYY